jgi:hypothetical protein
VKTTVEVPSSSKLSKNTHATVTELSEPTLRFIEMYLYQHTITIKTSLLGCYARVAGGSYFPTFRKIMVPWSSGRSLTHQIRNYIPSKRQELSAQRYGVTHGRAWNFSNIAGGNRDLAQTNKIIPFKLRAPEIKQNPNKNEQTKTVSVKHTQLYLNGQINGLRVNRRRTNNSTDIP